MKIEKCANSTEGDKYLYEYGQMTDMVQNPLRSVPFTVFKKVNICTLRKFHGMFYNKVATGACNLD